MRVPEGYRLVVEEDGSGIVRDDLSDRPLATWWSDGVALPGVHGRGPIEQIELGRGLSAALRRYRRGGALRNVLPDLFRDKNRANRELAVTAELRRRGVPVVEPLAAVSRRRGLLFELRLATALVADAEPMFAFLARHPERRALALRASGRAVRTAFERGMWHPDLHPGNVLVRSTAGDGGEDRCEVLLLDLDRAELRTGGASAAERDAMLMRMARFLFRHSEDLPAPAHRSDFLHFLRGYGLDRRARRATLGRLVPALDRALARRGLERASS